MKQLYDLDHENSQKTATKSQEAGYVRSTVLRCVVILPAYCSDDITKAGAWIEPLKRFDTVLADRTSRMRYVAMQQMLDAGAPYDIRSYWKANYLENIQGAAIDVFVDFEGVLRRKR